MSNLLEQASLVMIPSGYKEDIVYSEIPINGAGDLSFTRASNGTRINSQGLVEVCPWNLVQYSEDFTNAVYAKYNNITATADQTTAPNGATTADKIGLSTASTTFPNLAQDAQYIGGQVYTFSVYFKKNTVNFGKIRVGGTAFASSSNSPIFNLNTGVLVSGTGTIENVGNGWYRCSMTATADTSASGGFAIDLPDSAGVWNGSSVYNVNDSIFAWGFMSNIGSTAKPYFPTTDRLNVPRLTYQNGGGGCPSLLLEKQSTNLLTYSEEFDNANWTKAQGNGGTLPIITANYAISPDGTQNADRIQLTRTTQTSSFSYVYQTYIGTIGVSYTWSIWLKSLSGTPSVALSYDGSSYVNIVTLTTEWQRYTFTSNAINTSIQATFLLFQNLSGTSLSADFLAWGFQLEASSYPTSYIPTTSSSATRVRDAVYKTGISSLIGQTTGTIFLEMTPVGLVTTYTERLIKIYGGGQEIGLQRYSDSRLVGYGYLGGASNEWTFDIANVFTSTTQSVKIAMAYASNDVAIYVNGIQKGTDTSASMFSSLSAFTFAEDITGDLLCSQNIKQAVIFPTRLTNAELASLTTI